MRSFALTDFFDKIKFHTVTVCGGSGVCVQPLGEDYSYIFTAKHVLFDKSKSATYLNASEIIVETHDKERITVIQRLIDSQHDAAILIVERRNEITLFRTIDDVARDQTVHLAGYPATRRDREEGSDRIREYRGVVAQTTLDKTTVKLDDTPSHEELVGVSGGGLFRNIENDIYLCAIESKIEGNPALEYHGRVVCIPLSVFDKLLTENTLEACYPPVHPPFLECFSSVSPRAFQFNGAGSPESLQFLQNLLQETIEKLRTGGLPQPIEIFKKLNKSLLIDKTPTEDLFDIRLWISFLEFLTVASIVDSIDQVDFSYLKVSGTKRKFLFSAAKGNWLTLLRQIYFSDLRGLSSGGVIIVSTTDFRGETPSKVTLDKVVTDISRVSPTRFQIDSTIRNPVREFQLQHWSALLRDCVVSKEDDYAKYNSMDSTYDADALLKKIRDEYCAFIGKC
jgi:hypothetical protein